jgi:pantoate--beta-alanine ligase
MRDSAKTAPAARRPTILASVESLRAAIGRFRAAGESVALIPTMGALHDGHLALVREGQRLCRRAVATIFVNPTQFAPSEDFASYPRDEAGDLAKLAAIGTDAVFMPPVEAMYPPGFATTVTVAGLSEGLCGGFRPGHFAGVATVVSKLLIQALPDVALFGEKDYQQLMVIKRLARDLDIPARIAGVPTVREADGLAMSSRNWYLTPEERAAAPALYRVLSGIASRLASGAEAAALLAEGRAALAAAGFGPVQYLALCDAETLEPLARADRPARLLAAAYLGKTRLIDNVPAGPA